MDANESESRADSARTIVIPSMRSLCAIVGQFVAPELAAIKHDYLFDILVAIIRANDSFCSMLRDLDINPPTLQTHDTRTQIILETLAETTIVGEVGRAFPHITETDLQPPR